MADYEKRLADYEQLCRDRNNGHLLTPDGLRFICEVYHYDVEKNGQHFFGEIAEDMSKKYN